MLPYGEMAKVLATSLNGFYKLYQANQQDTIANRLQPTGYVPPAELENKKAAEAQAGATTYAGQSADEARNARVVGNAVGNVQRNARSSSDILNSAANIEAGLGSKMANDISNRYQIWKQSALGRLMSTNARIGGYQNQDYWNYINYQRQLKGAAMQNRFGAVNDITGAAALAGDSAGTSGASDGMSRTSVPSNYFSGSADYNLPKETTEMYA